MAFKRVVPRSLGGSPYGRSFDRGHTSLLLRLFCGLPNNTMKKRHNPRPRDPLQATVIHGFDVGIQSGFAAVDLSFGTMNPPKRPSK